MSTTDNDLKPEELGQAAAPAIADALTRDFPGVAQVLAEAGLLARFHGGVRLPASTTENIAYRQRQRLNEDAKRAIAQAIEQFRLTGKVSAPAIPGLDA